MIGKRAKDVPLGKVADYILGYTCFNDVSERHIQREGGQGTRAKGFDTFALMGSWIKTAVSPEDLRIEPYLNGESKQSARTNDLIFGVAQLISFISSVMTLPRGDSFANGTSSGMGP